MRDRHQATIRDLRLAIDCLPQRTRVAMLRGINANPIIVGAYTDGTGICPMLAAHRNGGRTDFIGFAKAWDRFAFLGTRPRLRRPRRATQHELLILRSELEASLIAEEQQADMAQAVREHRELIGRREPAESAESTGQISLVEAVREHQELIAQRERAAVVATENADPGDVDAVRPGDVDTVRPGDPDRSRELRDRHGWRWMRVVRTYDDYERVLDALTHEHESVQERESLLRELELQLEHS